MPDYSKGKIYTIRCRNDDTLIYVGSTIQSLAVRWGGHKRCKKNMPLYQTINNDWTDWFIELYQEYPCENKEQLHKREGEVIREIGTLNKNIAGRTKKEYREDNKDNIKVYRKEYRENNLDTRKEYDRQYYKDNCDKKKEQIKENYKLNADEKKHYQREYRKKNAKMIKEKKKEYNEANKEKIDEKNREYRQRKKLEKQAIPN